MITGEINDDDWRNDDLDISGLSLMDEDDSLLLLFPDDHTSGTTDKEDRGLLDWFGDDDIYNCELHKYNLRKSLAWDKAFFTNAGVLEPDELRHMIESNHVGEKRVLATIQEDVKRSMESISTLKSDETTSQDCVLSEDVKAPTQKSAAVSTDMRASIQREPTPRTLDDPDSHGKVKPNAILKRPSIRAQGSGKVTTNKPVAAKEHNTSMFRPSTGLSKSVRASADVNKTKQGESPVAPRVTISRRVRPIVSSSKPGPPSKSALRSSSSVASKNELTSSCSSLESCISAASSSASRDSVQQKKASNYLVNGSTSRAAAASKLIGQSRVSPLSASSTYKPRLPSNASTFLSASVDWSFNSPRASTPNKMAKRKKKTVSGGSSPAIDNPMPDQQGAKHGSFVNGGTMSSASVTKPIGLRVPSPKLGYFDGARSSVARTPTGSCTGPVSGSAKHGAPSLNESTTSSRTKSRLIQESTNSKAKGRPVSRSSRLVISASASSLKLPSNKTYSKVSAEERLKGNAVEVNLAQ